MLRSYTGGLVRERDTGIHMYSDYSTNNIQSLTSRGCGEGHLCVVTGTENMRMNNYLFAT